MCHSISGSVGRTDTDWLSINDIIIHTLTSIVAMTSVEAFSNENNVQLLL